MRKLGSSAPRSVETPNKAAAALAADAMVNSANVTLVQRAPVR